MNNGWYVITGGPAVGKTTLLGELEKRGYAIVSEAARLVIDEGLARGLSVAEIRKDEEKFQEEVLRRKVTAEAELNGQQPLFFDRGMHDTLAYYRYYGYKVSSEVRQALQRSRYQKVFLLEVLSSFTRDYARTETGDFPRRIHQLLHDAYTEYGMKPVLVPPMTVEERVQFILQNLK